MDRSSFYGGPNGQSFQIKQIFKTKTEMLTDLSLSWQSPIGVSDYVIISYGLPGDYDYYYVNGSGNRVYVDIGDTSIVSGQRVIIVSGTTYPVQEVSAFTDRQQQDSRKYGHSYNATLWQKIYTENNQAQIDALSGIETEYIALNYGLGYKLVAAMTGDTPRFIDFFKVLHSYETPYWKIYDYVDPAVPETANAGLSRVYIGLHLPMEQRVEWRKVTGLVANDEPVFHWDTTAYNYEHPENATWDIANKRPVYTNCGNLKSDKDSNRNAIRNGRDNPILWIGIPPHWEWELDFDTDFASSHKPKCELEMKDDGTAQILKITLPRMWKMQLDFEVLKASVLDPVAKLEMEPIDPDADPLQSDMQTFTLKLPRPWQWDHDLELLEASEKPKVEIEDDETTDPDKSVKIIHFKLPKPWEWELDYDSLSANEQPEVEVYDDPDAADPTKVTKKFLKVRLPRPWQWTLLHKNDKANTHPSARLITLPEIDGQVLELITPRAWEFELKTIENAVTADKPPELEQTDDGDKQTITVKLPKVWKWSLKGTEDGDEYDIVDAGEDPAVELTNDSDENQYLKFTLPKSQKLKDPETEWLGPLENPKVEMDDDPNEPTLTFHLPKAVKFRSGDKLGEKRDYTDETDDSFKELEKGDHYVNEKTGFAYIVTKIDQDTGKADFVYKACLHATLPKIEYDDPDPFDEDTGDEVPIDVEATDGDENTGWGIKFTVPKRPTFSVEEDIETLGPEETGKVELTLEKDETTQKYETRNLKFGFSLPRGAHIFIGDAVNSKKDKTTNKYADVAVVDIADTSSFDEAKGGDIYVNTSTGAVYKYQESAGIWMGQTGDMRGPAGEPLHHKGSYTIEVDDTDATTLAETEDTLSNGYQKIEAEFDEVDDDGDPVPITSDMIFTVTWVEKDSVTNEETRTAYWYYKLDNGDWTRAQITSSFSLAMIGDYSDDENEIDEKTYTVRYINSLIGGNVAEKPDKTTFSKDQIYDLFSWGDIADLASGFPDDPVPPNTEHDTLSAEEIVDLMSWHSIISLQLP